MATQDTGLCCANCGGAIDVRTMEDCVECPECGMTFCTECYDTEADEADEGSCVCHGAPRTEIIRAKWTMDEATTLSEAAAMLRAAADRLEELEKEGWQLVRPIADDYGFITQAQTENSDGRRPEKA
jgi:hypothetical protein